MYEEYAYLVATQCMTYNHARFIQDALHGFAIQETDFPVAFVVIDDASTDGEQDVLEAWANDNLEIENDYSIWEDIPCGRIAKATIKGKPLSTLVILLLTENHTQTGKGDHKRGYVSEWLDNAKYNAICEGDDYWVNPRKLQIQVDFMESHPDYVLCYTDFDLSNGLRRNHFTPVISNDNYFPQSIIHGVQIGTATTLFRKDVFLSIPRLNKDKCWSMGDLPMWIEMSHEGKFKFLPIVTAHYRIADQSASHGSLEKEISFAKESLAIRHFYADYYGVPFPNNGYRKGFYVTLMKCAFKHHDKQIAGLFLKEAIDNKMISFKLLLFYLGTMTKFGSFFLSRFYRGS